MRKKIMRLLLPAAIGLLSLQGLSSIEAGASETNSTTFPVVFAHGLGGIDDIFGFHYFGDDYGAFVGNPCRSASGWQPGCNPGLAPNQQTFAARLTPFQSSEIRGTELANEIESYMATVGVQQVNIIGHSQGGSDARKAAHVLRARSGRQVVRVLFTVSTPHRGSPVALSVLSLGPAAQIVDFLATVFGNIVYGERNDGYAAAKQLVYTDVNPGDDVLTGMQAFNENYPNSPNVAERYVSVVTAQRGVTLTPGLALLKALVDIDGDGACPGDCDGDGAGGGGDGRRDDLDDDGLVGINSQQNGYRLKYNTCFLCPDSFTTQVSLGYAADANRPNRQQMSSSAAILVQDHLDVIGVGPDTFDEREFYAAAIRYIADYD